MKKLILALLVLMAFTGCTSRTMYGECVGVMDQKNPKLTYEYSGWNIFVGFIFSETIIVPVVVASKNLWCPDGVTRE